MTKLRGNLHLVSLAFGCSFALLAADMLIASSAQAIPAFARSTNKTCSGCHTAWPLLNKTGRAFRENGFKLKRTDQLPNVISRFLQLDESFPVSAVIKARPYDKKKSGDAKMRAIHEVEVLVGGSVAPDVSLFFELEAEDEADFKVEMGEGRLGWHPSKSFNLVLAKSTLFTLDSSDILSGRRLTRNRNSIMEQSFGGADNGGKLKSSRQSVQIYGRPIDQVFYNIGYSGIAGDNEGVNPRNFSGRLAVDVIPELTLGGFGVLGTCKSSAAGCSKDRDFTRLGLDAQLNYKDLRISAAYMATEDDLDTTGTVNNSAMFAEAIYVLKKDGRPWIVPLVRFDHYEKSDGADDFSEVTLNLGYYHWENVRAYFEIWHQLDVPEGTFDDTRFTFQVEIAF